MMSQNIMVKMERIKETKYVIPSTSITENYRTRYMKVGTKSHYIFYRIRNFRKKKS